MQRSMTCPASKICTPVVLLSSMTKKSVCALLSFISPSFYLLPAGQDATEAFYSLHRAEVLEKPQYKRLQIGTIQGEASVIRAPIPGQLSLVPYGEPSWLVEGFHSPYYTEVCILFSTLEIHSAFCYVEPQEVPSGHAQVRR
jgi:hypothetical protein